MLILRYNNNEFNFRMSWPEVVHLLKEEDSYKAMLQIEGYYLMITVINFLPTQF